MGDGKWVLEFVVFEVGAAGFFDGVAEFVAGEFGLDFCGEVEAELVGDFEEEDGDVGYFVGDEVAFLLGDCEGLGRGFPDEGLEEFAGFSDDGDGEVFGAMELLPVAGVAEGADLGGEFGDGHFGGGQVLEVGGKGEKEGIGKDGVGNGGTSNVER